MIPIEVYILYLSAPLLSFGVYFFIRICCMFWKW